MLDAADPTVLGEQPPRGLDDAHLVPGVAEHQHATGRPRPRVEVPGVGGGHRERLLGEDVAARLEGRARLLGSRAARSCQDEEVRPRLDDLTPVGRRTREAEARSHLLEERRVAAADDERLHVVACRERRQVRGDRPGAGADDAQRRGHGISQPPLTSMTAPFTYDALSEARKSTTEAISDGSL